MKSGDLVFVHRKSAIGKAIRMGEWLHFRDGAFYNHTATLIKPTGFGDDWWVIQASADGVTWGVLSGEGTSYTILSAPAEVDTEKQLAFLYSQLGKPYGYFTIASIIITLLVPWDFFNVMFPDTWICSALAAEAMRAGGWIHSWPDLYQVTPAQLYEETTIESE